MTLRSLTYPIIAFLAAACSMKEDRTECPCHLTVDLEEASDETGVRLICFADSMMLNDAWISPESLRYPHMEDVPRKEICIAGLQGLDGNSVDGCNVIIPKGKQADRIYLYMDRLDCSGENAWAHAEFHKNWATLEICSGSYGPVSKTLEFIITGEVCGYSLIDGKPVYGEFSCSAELADPSFMTYTVNLPRQDSENSGLYLTILNTAEDRTVLTCGLSDIFEGNGYDWEKPDLDDILLNFDKTGLDISVTVKDWKEGEDISVSI
ncbi:MAG: hypothetical protein ACI3ZC_07015 [Candidatus Cryptobacteroides sp.]